LEMMNSGEQTAGSESRFRSKAGRDMSRVS